MSSVVRTVSRMARRHHTFDYIELAAPDLAAAKSFYADAFGWTFTDYGPAYTGIHDPTGDREMGGFNPVRPAGTGLPLVILYSDDLDATLASVQAAGGSVSEGPFQFPGGRRFHFTDPAGNELAVWTEA
jgi:uncharacterized protein